ncbi:hypothetical protein [Neorhizobium tomejilense]|uniref:hypothetical protein n=1 Tax=Neorhizobium tomejilense TaxID=2093828 RepID=UPI003ECEE9D0
MTPKAKPSTRTYSKRLTAWCLVAIFSLAFYGISVGTPDLADILAIVGSTSIAHQLLYMGIGHLDLRSLASVGGLLDLRRKGKPDA